MNTFKRACAEWTRLYERAFGPLVYARTQRKRQKYRKQTINKLVTERAAEANKKQIGWFRGWWVFDSDLRPSRQFCLSLYHLVLQPLSERLEPLLCFCRLTGPGQAGTVDRLSHLQDLKSPPYRHADPPKPFMS